jgi:hypothetical protein
MDWIEPSATTEAPTPRPAAIRIATISDPTFEVVVFSLPTGGAEAVITAPDSPRKPVNIVIDPPPKGKRIVTTRYPDGTVEITYKEVP